MPGSALERWRICNQAGLKWLNDPSKLNDAEEAFLGAIREAEELTPAHRALSYANLAAVRRRQGRLDDARQFLQESLGILQFEMVDPAVVANIHRELALVYEQLSHQDLAEKEFERALDKFTIAAKEAGKRNFNTGKEGPLPWERELSQVLMRLGVYRHERKQLDEAADFFQRGAELTERVYGENHRNVAEALMNLAAIRCDQGQWAEARRLYQRCMTIYKENNDPKALSAIQYYLAAVKADPTSTRQTTAFAEASLQSFQRELQQAGIAVEGSGGSTASSPAQQQQQQQQQSRDKEQEKARLKQQLAQLLARRKPNYAPRVPPQQSKQ